MAKIFLVKFNGAYSWGEWALCRKTIFGRSYMSRNTGSWYTDPHMVKYYCRTTKEVAYKMFEKETGKKLEDTY